MKYQNIAVIIAVAFAGSASVQANDNMTTVWTTDFNGKPPYQRQKEILSSADFARFETTTEVVISTNFSGKPPFSRNVEMVRVVDANRLEIAEESRFVPTPRRGKI
jgi:hypothetical protein